MSTPMHWRVWIVSLTACALFPPSGMAYRAGEHSQEPIVQAESALRQAKFRQAIEWATRAIEQAPERPDGYVIRGLAHRGLGQFKDAIGDFAKALALRPDAQLYLQRSYCYSELDEHAQALDDTNRALELDPLVRGAYRHRGRVQFKLGKVQDSIGDFDRFAELEPGLENDLWERGLSRYYAGDFAGAQKSFEDFHKVGPSDIENGLWRMLSQAEIEGLAFAQANLLKYETKRRPPFPDLYELYSGKMEPDRVLEQAADGARDESDRRTRLFYTHLYLGMWYVVKRDTTSAIQHLDKAVALRSTDYMWYVARLQRERLEAETSTQ